MDMVRRFVYMATMMLAIFTFTFVFSEQDLVNTKMLIVTGLD